MLALRQLAAGEGVYSAETAQAIAQKWMAFTDVIIGIDMVQQERQLAKHAEAQAQSPQC